jgi:hypothetical protein
VENQRAKKNTIRSEAQDNWNITKFKNINNTVVLYGMPISTEHRALAPEPEF